MVSVRGQVDSTYAPMFPTPGGDLAAQLSALGIRPESLYQALWNSPDSFELLRQTLDRDGDGKLDKDITPPNGVTQADLQLLIDYLMSRQGADQGRPAPARSVGNLGGNGGYQSSRPVQNGWNGGGGDSGGGSGSGGGSTSAGGASAPTQPPGTTTNIKDAKRQPLTAAEKAEVSWDKLSPELREAAEIAKAMGLRVTSGAEGHDGDGVHTTGSNHYKGRAIDVAGSPEQMARFYNLWKDRSPRELFYDPLGGIKNGRQIGAIGGHSDHVHLAM